MVAGIVARCGVDSISGKTPSELWSEVNSDGQVTQCEASQFRAFYSEYSARLNGSSAGAPRFNNEAEMNRELAALQKISRYCSGGTNSCERVPDQIVARPWDDSATLGLLAMAGAPEVPLGEALIDVFKNMLIVAGVSGGIMYLFYKLGWRIRFEDVPAPY